MTVTEIIENAVRDTDGVDAQLQALQDQYLAAASEGLADILQDLGIEEDE